MSNPRFNMGREQELVIEEPPAPEIPQGETVQPKVTPEPKTPAETPPAAPPSQEEVIPESKPPAQVLDQETPEPSGESQLKIGDVDNKSENTPDQAFRLQEKVSPTEGLES